jgi:inhibitor of growth protein 3
MTSLLIHIPNFNPSILARHTVYPHISPRSYAPISMYENNRRRRGTLLAGTADQSNSSNKRRRVAREDDVDPVGGKTPRRERNPDANNSRSRNGARSRKFVELFDSSAPTPTDNQTKPLSLPVEPIARARPPSPFSPSPPTSQPTPSLPHLPTHPQPSGHQTRATQPPNDVPVLPRRPRLQLQTQGTARPYHPPPPQRARQRHRQRRRRADTHRTYHRMRQLSPASVPGPVLCTRNSRAPGCPFRARCLTPPS